MIWKFAITGICLLLMCSCAMTGQRRDALEPAKFPWEVSFNKRAGHGDLLIVKVRLEDGKELPFIVDTGASMTSLDKSLEGTLGKRLGSKRIWTWNGPEVSGLYTSPKLFLGTNILITGERIAVRDFAELSSRSGQLVMGTIGMDCLRHYCVRLDFSAGKLQFIDPNSINTNEFGISFKLRSSRLTGEAVISCGSLIGEHGKKTLLDTGCNFDGFLQSQIFQREVKQNNIPLMGGLAYFPECVWHGEHYSDLVIKESSGSWLQRSFLGGNLMGLKFLARHEVILDFPRGIIFLRRIPESIGESTDPAK
jgi:hypothetical protein